MSSFLHELIEKETPFGIKLTSDILSDEAEEVRNFFKTFSPTNFSREPWFYFHISPEASLSLKWKIELIKKLYYISNNQFVKFIFIDYYLNELEYLIRLSVKYKHFYSEVKKAYDTSVKVMLEGIMKNNWGNLPFIDNKIFLIKDIKESHMSHRPPEFPFRGKTILWAFETSKKIKEVNIDGVCGILHGGVFPSFVLSKIISKPVHLLRFSFYSMKDTYPKFIDPAPVGERIIVVDDVYGKGRTLQIVSDFLKKYDNEVLTTAVSFKHTSEEKIYKPSIPPKWITFPQSPYRKEILWEAYGNLSLKIAEELAAFLLEYYPEVAFRISKTPTSYKYFVDEFLSYFLKQLKSILKVRIRTKDLKQN